MSFGKVSIFACSHDLEDETNPKLGHCCFPGDQIDLFPALLTLLFYNRKPLFHPCLFLPYALLIHPYLLHVSFQALDLLLHLLSTSTSSRCHESLQLVVLQFKRYAILIAMELYGLKNPNL
ncbi:hypothetical protein V6N13_031759 [Hibiscus sabdariffa]